MRILNQRRTLILFVIAAVYAFYGLAFASGGGDAAGGDGGGHGGPVLSILIELIVILLAAKHGGDIDIIFEKRRKNDVKLLLLMDVGGSMTPYAHMVNLLFSWPQNSAATFSNASASRPCWVNWCSE